ncbi:glutamate-cysteine ligase family protein, partial [bacterium]|nr:glutamate-cysteine ligase family protein [bacterium]
MLETLSKYIQNGAKDKKDHKIGAEYELISITTDKTPVSFTKTPSIMCVLKSLQSKYKLETGEIIDDKLFSLKAKVGSITIEPGCQIELSATPRTTINELHEDLSKYSNALKEIGQNCNIKFLASPTNPYLHPDQIPLLPKKRYQIMNDLFSRTGSHGKFMMRASASIQVCMDYTDPKDLMKKYVLSLFLSPFVKALFSSSPFCAGKLTP